MLNESEKIFVLKKLRKMLKRHSAAEVKLKMVDFFDFMMESLFSAEDAIKSSEDEKHD